MADSIAKLAVVITGDASPLAQATNRASNIVRGFGNEFTTFGQKSGQGLNLATQSAYKLSTALSAARGNLGAAFTVGGPALLAITAMTAGVLKLAAAGDTLMQKLGADKLDTWAGQWERVNEQIGIMGTTFTTIAAEASSGLADMLAGINESLFPDSVAYTNALKARQDAAKKAVEHGKKQEEANKRQIAINKKAAEEQQRERDAMLDMANARRDRADQIRESVMSPAKEMQRTFHELRSMFDDGLIDEETAMRAGMKAREAFDNASGSRSKEAQARTGAAAAERFTMAGFSAAQSGQRQIEQQLRVQQQQLKAEQEQVKRQQETNDLLRKMKPGGVTLVRSGIS